jgi:hypothetical protein
MSYSFETKIEGTDFTREELVEFIHEAASNSYAGGNKYELLPERPGFKELKYVRGEWSYRDSFAGYFKSRGMEVVRYRNEVVWSALYGGGMVTESYDREFAREIFGFLRKCLSVDGKGFDSYRGPAVLQIGKWKYAYQQEGDVTDFSGFESIEFQKKKVFEHRIIGGLVVGK